MVKSHAPIALDPGGYGGTYKLIGGRPSLDFVNTISYPHTHRRHDWLDRWANVLAWAVATGLADPVIARRLKRRLGSHPAEAGRALARIRLQRAAVTRVVTPLACGARPAARDVAALNRLLAAACPHRQVDADRLEWIWEPPRRLDDLIRPVVLDAADLLTRADRSRLGQCPSCRWLFLDTTRNRRRRWCDMADCGSRDKALRYYRRARARASGR